jgi:hypothetical protein
LLYQLGQAESHRALAVLIQYFTLLQVLVAVEVETELKTVLLVVLVVVEARTLL